MNRKDKVTTLILVLITCLGYGGCTANFQVGKENHFNQEQKTQRDKSYRERLRTGKVSIQESFERAHRER